MARNSLPPFLEKLARITKTVDSNIAGWSDDGKNFVIKNSEKFEHVLKQHFKGNAQTFVRQLHFYGFRKLDSQNSGGWSFAHVNFRKDSPHLLGEIRRKTRIDPTAENIASHVEVQALRTQVAHLQDVVEDLRTQLDSVITVLDEAEVVNVDRRCDGKPLKVSAGNKRPRTAVSSEKDSDTFNKIVETVKPVMATTATATKKVNPIMINDVDLESASLGSLTESDMLDVNEILNLNSKQKENNNIKNKMMENLLKTSPAKWAENPRTKYAVQTIAKATKLDEASVSKVLRYFADMTPSTSTGTAEGKAIEQLPEHFQDSLSFKKLGHFTPLPPLKRT
mmetsp:Transcript_14702/g.17172  ORF Transcript_14702/g.17172 Transcript_14702/m.17172 type:complete len:337 (+) Transcript_14702:503-1513(+)